MARPLAQVQEATEGLVRARAARVLLDGQLIGLLSTKETMKEVDKPEEPEGTKVDEAKDAQVARLEAEMVEVVEGMADRRRLQQHVEVVEFYREQSGEDQGYQRRRERLADAAFLATQQELAEWSERLAEWEVRQRALAWRN